MTKIKDKVKHELTAYDRCDRCSAQGYVKARGINGELIFCGHHYAKAQDKIGQWAFEVIDEREMAKCSCSSCNQTLTNK
jgi:hypothetical protein